MKAKRIITAILIMVAGVLPVTTFALNKSSPFYYGVWLPFWKAQPGQQDIALHLDSIDEISPFSYDVNGDGTLVDALGIGSGDWFNWLSAIHDSKTKVIPTIAWFDGPSIYNLLSSTFYRRAEENMIAGLVKAEQFDGIDIDFESMLPETRPYYSLFIQGLAIRLHPAGRKLTCTVSPRTPVASLYDSNPLPDVTYAENYSVLNQYCDEVRVMAYDQGQIDIKLDASKGNGTLYAPTADPAWVEKVIQETLQSVSPKKIMLGIPTYGYEYQVSWNAGATTYERVRSFTFFQAMDRADTLGVAPVRNNAGELSFTFATSTHIYGVPSVLTAIVESTQPLALADPSENASTTFYASFSDAQSAADKLKLVRKYGLRGAMFFKADGDMDPATWDIMQ